MPGRIASVANIMGPGLSCLNGTARPLRIEYTGAVHNLTTRTCIFNDFLSYCWLFIAGTDIMPP